VLEGAAPSTTSPPASSTGTGTGGRRPTGARRAPGGRAPAPSPGEETERRGTAVPSPSGGPRAAEALEAGRPRPPALGHRPASCRGAGKRQRVAIARAIVGRPALLWPTDRRQTSTRWPANRSSDLLARAHAGGATIAVITHEKGSGDASAAASSSATACIENERPAGPGGPPPSRDGRAAGQGGRPRAAAHGPRGTKAGSATTAASPQGGGP